MSGNEPTPSVAYTLPVPPIPNGAYMAETSTPVATVPASLPIPQYFRVKQVADRLAIDAKSILRRVKDDPDVLVLSERKRGVRKYQTYLIPESTLQRLVNSLRQRG